MDSFALLCHSYLFRVPSSQSLYNLTCCLYLSVLFTCRTPKLHTWDVFFVFFFGVLYNITKPSQIPFLWLSSIEVTHCFLFTYLLQFHHSCYTSHLFLSFFFSFLFFLGTSQGSEDPSHARRGGAWQGSKLGRGLRADTESMGYPCILAILLS